MRRINVYITYSLMAVFLVGCAGRRLHRPDIPKALDRTEKSVFYNIKDFKADYDKYKEVVTTDPPLARSRRDAMINRIRVDIEMNYRAYESHLFVGRATNDVAWDFLEQLITFSTTVSNGERAKTVLSAVLAGVKGTRLSIDKNFFREKTIEIIITKMQANRDKIKNIIIRKTSDLSVSAYPFEEAWVDLTEFFYAGTLQGGIQALAADAGKDAAETKQKTEDIQESRVLPLFPIATSEQEGDARLIREKADELFERNDTAAARRALQELGVSVADNATDVQIWDLLDEQISKINREVEGRAEIDQEQVRKLKRALRIR